MMTEPEVLQLMRNTLATAERTAERGALTSHHKQNALGQLWGMTIIVGTSEAFMLNTELAEKLDKLPARKA